MSDLPPPPLHFLNPADPDLPMGLRALLQRRHGFASAYQFDVAPLITEFLDGLVTLDLMRDRPVGFMTICTLERSNATLRSGQNATIIFDLGFLEVLSDYLIVANALQDAVQLTSDDAPYWGVAAQTQPKADSYAIIRAIYARFGASASHLDPTDDDDDAQRLGPAPGAPFTITGSQLFRDIAAKMMMTAWDGSYNRSVFEAFCVWTVEIAGRNYRPGPMLANHLLAAPSTPADVRQRYWLAMAFGVRQILCHEYAHCMFDRTAPERWRTTHEYRLVQQRLEALAKGRSDPRWLSLLAAPDQQSARTRRAVSESFFDIRALNIIIAADGLPVRDALWATQYLSYLLEVTLRNIVLMAMRDVMAAAMRDSQSMETQLFEALGEVQHRGMIVFCALANMLAEQYGEAAVAGLHQRYAACIDQILMLAKFFMIDLGNNLPPGGNARTTEPDDEFARGWARLIEAITE